MPASTSRASVIHLMRMIDVPGFVDVLCEITREMMRHVALRLLYSFVFLVFFVFICPRCMKTRRSSSTGVTVIFVCSARMILPVSPDHASASSTTVNKYLCKVRWYG